MASFLKKNYSVILLIIISMCVGLYISISPILKEKAAQAVFLSKEKEWNYLANNKAEFKDGKPVKVSGTLTIRGVSKPVTLDVTYLGAATDPWGNARVGYTASTTINRKDFGLTWNKNLDGGGVVVGDEVTIKIEGEGIAQKK